MSAARGTIRLVAPLGIGGHANDGTDVTPGNVEKNSVFMSGHARPENTHAFMSAHEKKIKNVVSVSSETHRKGVRMDLAA